MSIYSNNYRDQKCKMEEKEKIIKRLKDMGLEIQKQDNRSTCNPMFGIKLGVSKNGTAIIDNHSNSFFESDVEFNINASYVSANNDATKMNELRVLLIQLSSK